MNQISETLSHQAHTQDEINRLGLALAELNQSHIGGQCTPLTEAERHELAKLIEAYHPTFLLSPPSHSEADDHLIH